MGLRPLAIALIRANVYSHFITTPLYSHLGNESIRKNDFYVPKIALTKRVGLRRPLGASETSSQLHPSVRDDRHLASTTPDMRRSYLEFVVDATRELKRGRRIAITRDASALVSMVLLVSDWRP